MTQTNRGGAPDERPAPKEIDQPGDRHQGTATGEYPNLAPLLRRRYASQRCPPLRCGRRDPWPELPREHWTERERASWRLAWRHLTVRGLRPVVPAEVYDDPDQWGDADTSREVAR